MQKSVGRGNSNINPQFTLCPGVLVTSLSLLICETICGHLWLQKLERSDVGGQKSEARHQKRDIREENHFFALDFKLIS